MAIAVGLVELTHDIGAVRERLLPVLNNTHIQAGTEYSFANDMRRNSNDFNGIAGAVQLSNVSAYLGYEVSAQVGLKVDRKNFKGREAETLTVGFITLFAGLGK